MKICFFPCLNSDTTTKKYDLYCLHKATELSESEPTRTKADYNQGDISLYLVTLP